MEPELDLDKGIEAKAEWALYAYREGLYSRQTTNNEIIRLVYPTMIRYARFRLALAGSKEDAEDIVHDVLVRFLGMIDVPNFLSTPAMAYFRRAITNMILDRVRAKKADPMPRDVAVDPAPQWMIRQAIMDAIDELPEKWGYVVSMCLVEGYTEDEVAEELKIQRSTVSYYKRMGLQELRKSEKLKALVKR